MMGIYNLTSGTVTCTITARPEENYGYYFGGLPSGIYTAHFSTDAFALGDYKDSTQNAEVSDEKAAFDAAGGFVNSVGGTEGTTNRGDGYWLSFTIVENNKDLKWNNRPRPLGILPLHNDIWFPALGSSPLRRRDAEGRYL